jgi:large subunit ribosomal protein L29
MADYLKAAAARALNREERTTRLKDLRQELMHERGVAAMGGSPPSPGKIRQIRRQIARLLTIDREDVLTKQGRFHRRAPTRKTAKAPSAAPATAPKKKGE